MVYRTRCNLGYMALFNVIERGSFKMIIGQRPAITAPPLLPVTQKKKKLCTHKYDLLEYPSGTRGYLFYCIFCLEIQEKVIGGPDHETEY